jgi:putative transposase
VPVGLAIDGANRHDSKMARATLESIPVKRPKPTRTNPQGMCLDKGYDYDNVRDLVKEFGYTAHIKARGEEAQAIKRQAGFKARRWVVERTHSWMNRFRRILTRWEKKVENYFYCNRFILNRRDEAVAGTDLCGRASGRFSLVRCEPAQC